MTAPATENLVPIACPNCKRHSRFGLGHIGDRVVCPRCHSTVEAVLDRTHSAFDWFAPDVPPHIRAQGERLMAGILQSLARERHA